MGDFALLCVDHFLVMRGPHVGITQDGLTIGKVESREGVSLGDDCFQSAMLAINHKWQQSSNRSNDGLSTECCSNWNTASL